MRNRCWVLWIGCMLCCWRWDSIMAQGNGTIVQQDALNACTGVFLTYSMQGTVKRIWPYTDVAAEQPYGFEADVTLTNTGYEDVLGWEVFIGFQHREVIADAEGILFLDGSSTPGVKVGNGASLFGVDRPDLKNSIDTAQDLDLIRVNFTLTGTEFGVGPKDDPPLPKNISLLNAGWDCGAVTISPGKNAMWVCCAENKTALNDTESASSNYLDREKGNITMYYDVIQTWETHYVAKVTINLDDPVGRLDNWNLTWTWRHGEFIYGMVGAQTIEQGQENCVNGPAAKQYQQVDFSTVMSCEVTPTIIDLTPDRQYDTSVSLPHCCRNGTLLPALVDSNQTSSVFSLDVYKIPPNLARDSFAVPVNWKIASGYSCSQPRLVSPSETADGSGRAKSAVISWQVTCNKTVETSKKCCVSFSAFYNDSVIPCPTCACGCSQSQSGQTCNPNIDALLLPSSALLIPAANRSSLAMQLAKLHHYPTPDVLPCPDNCGVNLNWHIYSDYRNGWSARLTLFNWENSAVPEWFAAVQLQRAMPGLQGVYTFNGSVLHDPDFNNTLLVQGHAGYNNNYLLGLKENNPGKLQSLMSFNKKLTPGIKVTGGDGFPDRVWFNGEECSLPQTILVGGASHLLPSLQHLCVIVTTFVLLGVTQFNLV